MVIGIRDRCIEKKGDKNMRKFVKHPYYKQWFNVDLIQEVKIKGFNVELSIMDYDTTTCIRFDSEKEAEEFIDSIID